MGVFFLMAYKPVFVSHSVSVGVLKVFIDNIWADVLKPFFHGVWASILEVYALCMCGYLKLFHGIWASVLIWTDVFNPFSWSFSRCFKSFFMA